jgi:hypothetical protein
VDGCVNFQDKFREAASGSANFAVVLIALGLADQFFAEVNVDGATDVISADAAVSVVYENPLEGGPSPSTAHPAHLQPVRSVAL